MLSEVFSAIEGIALLPVISLLLTLAVFLAIVVWAVRLDRKLVTKLEQLPLDSSDNLTAEGDRSHV